MSLLPIKHIQQSGIGDCLPACAQMALAQLGIHAAQAQLARTLGTVSGLGTPFSNVTRLKSLGVNVQIIEWQGIATLVKALVDGKAVIASILTSSDLPEWGNLQTQHAVLVLTVSPTEITYHDPALAYGPVRVKTDAFLLAWSDMSEQAALLSHARN